MINIHDELQELLRKTFENDSLVMTDEMTANDVDKWDSLMHIQLIILVEEHFGVKFKNAEIARLESIADLKALISKRLG